MKPSLKSNEQKTEVVFAQIRKQIALPMTLFAITVEKMDQELSPKKGLYECHIKKQK